MQEQGVELERGREKGSARSAAGLVQEGTGKGWVGRGVDAMEGKAVLGG